MKNALVTMIGLAALTLPAYAQEVPPVFISDASAAPQVEVPEGAFEIAVPRFGTELPVDRTPREDRAIPTRPSMEIVSGARLLEKSRSFSERSRARRVEILHNDATVHAPTADRVTVISRLGPAPSPRNIGTTPRTTRIVIVRSATVNEAVISNAPVAIVAFAERSSGTVAEAPIPTPEVPEYSRPEPEPPSAVELMAAANAGYSLSSAAPNPVSTSASISFTLPRAGRTELAVFDNAGRVVATLADDNLDAGTHTRTFDASGLPAGLYLYRLSSGGYAETKTMTVVR